MISAVRDMRQVIEALPSCRRDPCFTNLFKDLYACNTSHKLQVLGHTQVITVGPDLGLPNAPVSNLSMRTPLEESDEVMEH